MMGAPLVSIVLPIYKVELYLEKCVDSLLRQTYKNIQIILVDDGSPDECPEICDRYAAQDERVTVIHKENGGISSARNTGMAAAEGEYLAFVDSDDYVAETYIEDMLEACLRTGAQIAACGYAEVYEDGRVIDKCAPTSYVTTGEEGVKEIFTMTNRIHVVAWNKLYLRSLFTEGNITYPVGKTHEDVFTTYKLCAAAEQIAYINRPNYYYLQRADSIMGRAFSTKRLDAVEAVEQMRPFVEQNAPVYDDEYVYFRFLNYLTVLNSMADSGHKDRKLFTAVSKELFKLTHELNKTAYYAKKHKITVVCLHLGMSAFYLTRRLYRHLKPVFRR